jgi:hypothetical protein
MTPPQMADPSAAPAVDLAPGRPQSTLQWLRAIGNVVNLTTPLGLAIAAIGGSSFRRGPRGLVLCEGYRIGFPVAGAFTVGNVLTTPSTWRTKLREYPGLIEHEERHSWQYAYCLGLPFFPAYVICVGWSMLRTGDRAAGNFFERQAGLELGGYATYPTRPLLVGLRDLTVRLRKWLTSILGKAKS